MDKDFFEGNEEFLKRMFEAGENYQVFGKNSINPILELQEEQRLQKKNKPITADEQIDFHIFLKNLKGI